MSRVRFAITIGARLSEHHNNKQPITQHCEVQLAISRLAQGVPLTNCQIRRSRHKIMAGRVGMRSSSRRTTPQSPPQARQPAAKAHQSGRTTRSQSRDISDGALDIRRVTRRTNTESNVGQGGRQKTFGGRAKPQQGIFGHWRIIFSIDKYVQIFLLSSKPLAMVKVMLRTKILNLLKLAAPKVLGEQVEIDHLGVCPLSL